MRAHFGFAAYVMENHPYVMESSVLVHECTLRNIDLVADFFFFFVNGSDSSTGSNETFSPSSLKLLEFWACANCLCFKS